MCKSWNIRYSCSHIRTVRRSTCRGTFSGPSLRTGETKVRCSGSDPLKLASSSLCVSCQRAQVEAQIYNEVEALRYRHRADPEDDGIAAELALAEGEMNDKLWRLTNELPPEGPSKEFIRPVRSRTPGSACVRSSLLRLEVKPEDVVATDQWDPGWASEWASGWDSATEVDETVDDETEEVGLTWPDDDVIESIDWTLGASPLEPSAEVEWYLDVQLQPPSGDRSKPSSGTESVRPCDLVIPPHRRRRVGSTIRGRAQQVIEDLRSMHACGGYNLGVAVSN